MNPAILTDPVPCCAAVDGLSIDGNNGAIAQLVDRWVVGAYTGRCTYVEYISCDPALARLWFRLWFGFRFGLRWR